MKTFIEAGARLIELELRQLPMDGPSAVHLPFTDDDLRHLFVD